MKKINSSIPPVPKGLSAAARRWWKSLHSEYELVTPDQLLVLESGLQSYDRWQQARALVDENGTTLMDRFGQRKLNPDVLVERDSRLSMLRSFKALGLDIVPDETR